MASVPPVIEKWVRQYVEGKGAGGVSDVVVEKVSTRSAIPDRDGLYLVTDEDTIVMRVND